MGVLTAPDSFSLPNLSDNTGHYVSYRGILSQGCALTFQGAVAQAKERARFCNFFIKIKGKGFISRLHEKGLISSTLIGCQKNDFVELENSQTKMFLYRNIDI